MAKKNKAAKQQAVPSGPAYQITDVPPEGLLLPARGALKAVRERVGLSQSALAKESGVSHNVIANYESGRTGLDSIEQGLKIWRLLEAKARALNISEGKGKYDETAFLVGLLWYAKQSARKRLFEIDGQIKNLNREQESLKRRIGEFDAETAELKALP